ncbi:unnamed protein product, partial [marine sediment metagenome]
MSDIIELEGSPVFTVVSDYPFEVHEWIYDE